MAFFNNPNKDNTKKKGGKAPADGGKKRGSMNLPQPSGFWGNVATVIAVFAIFIAIYLLFAGNAGDTTTIPISQVASEVKASQIQSMTVQGDDVTIVRTDGKKET